MPVLLLVVLVLLAFAGSEAVTELVEHTTNGQLVGPATSLDADGEVDADPGALAQAAEYPVDEYSLARALMSEVGTEGNQYLHAVAWAIRNRAAERGTTITELVTAPSGLYGRQNAGTGAKFVATGQDPRERHAVVAHLVLTGQVPDPTGGATHFFSPRTQDVLAARDGGKDAAAIFAAWAAPGGLYPGGAVPVVPDGIDGNILTLWRRA